MLASAATARRAIASPSRCCRGISELRCWNALRHKRLLTAMAYVPEVDVSKYESQLADKVAKVKQLFSEYKSLPEFEVCACTHRQYIIWQVLSHIMQSMCVSQYHVLPMSGTTSTCSAAAGTM